MGQGGQNFENQGFTAPAAAWLNMTANMAERQKLVMLQGPQY